ncbi:hypothetical protein D3C80_1113650 [compost metagenome]
MLQLLHHPARLLDLLRHQLDAADGTPHHPMAFARGVGGRLGGTHGVRGVAGNLEDGGLHLVHGGGDLGHLPLLAGHALGGLLGDGTHLLHRAAELAHRARDLAHQLGQRPLHAIDGRAELAQFIPLEAVVADPLLQLAPAELAAGDALGLTGQHHQGIPDLAGQHGGEHRHQPQPQQQRDDDAQLGIVIGLHHLGAGVDGVAMVDANEIRHRLGQGGVEVDPLGHEEALGLGHLAAVLHLPDTLMQGDVLVPARLDDVEATALLHICRPDAGIVRRYLLSDLSQALLAGIAVMGLLLGIVRHQEHIQLVAAQGIDGLTQSTGAHHGGQYAVGEADGGPVHLAELQQREAADEGHHQAEHGEAGGEFLTYRHGVHGVSCIWVNEWHPLRCACGTNHDTCHP